MVKNRKYKQKVLKNLRKTDLLKSNFSQKFNRRFISMGACSNLITFGKIELYENKKVCLLGGQKNVGWLS